MKPSGRKGGLPGEKLGVGAGHRRNLDGPVSGAISHFLHE